MFFISTYFLILYFFNDAKLTSVIFSELTILRAYRTRFSIYIHVIYFFHLKICTNEYFDPNCFSKREFFLLPWFLVRTIYETKKSTHSDYFLVVSTQSLYALSFRYLDLCNDMQCIHSVVLLQNLNSYSKIIQHVIIITG